MAKNSRPQNQEPVDQVDDDDDMPDKETLPEGATVTSSTTDPKPAAPATKQPDLDFVYGIVCCHCQAAEQPKVMWTKGTTRGVECARCSFRQVVTYRKNESTGRYWPDEQRKMEAKDYPPKPHK